MLFNNLQNSASGLQKSINKSLKQHQIYNNWFIKPQFVENRNGQKTSKYCEKIHLFTDIMFSFS